MIQAQPLPEISDDLVTWTDNTVAALPGEGSDDLASDDTATPPVLRLVYADAACGN